MKSDLDQLMADHGLDALLVMGNARGNTVLFSSDGDSIVAMGGIHGGRFILVAGKPLREPIARYGPFVMNTEAEIRQAFADYQAGRLGR